MSAGIHVWLLQPSRPTSPERTRDALTRLARQPGALPWWLSWLGPLGVWIWAAWWTPRLLAAPSAPPDDDEPARQARDLERLLGEGWSVHPVRDEGAHTLELAAAHLPHGATLALVELCALGGPASEALVQSARLAATARGARLLDVPPLHSLDGWREGVAEALRETLADLPRGLSYDVLFCVTGATGGGPEGQVAQALVTDLVRRTGLARPAHLAFLPGPSVSGGRPGLRDALALMRAAPPGAALLVPLNSADPADLTPAQQALFSSIYAVDARIAPAPLPRATSTRALCDGLKDAAAGRGRPEPTSKTA